MRGLIVNKLTYFKNIKLKSSLIKKLTNNKWNTISIALSSIGIVAGLFIEHNIFIDYQNASGKTQALFGLNELLGYSEKKYIVGLGLVSLILSLIALRKKEQKSLVQFSIITGILCFILPFIRIWRFFT